MLWIKINSRESPNNSAKLTGEPLRVR